MSTSGSAAAAAAAASRANCVGPYRLGKTLGVGSFCKVKLAVHETTNQRVAIKCLNRAKLKKMDMGEKVRTEIHILRLFKHPHIIRLYEVIDTATDIFSVMEYVPGGELFDYIVSRGRLEEKEARKLFQQIVSGVEYCHVHNVVHRDLKPENLLLDADNSVKIADFGLSNRLKDGQLLKTSCGSPNYAAPEVISGNLYAGPEVDVWSCGVILYAILCGSLPFDDENIRNLFRKIKAGDYTIPSYVSAGARDLMSRMLIVDPLRRISIQDIRRHAWFQTNLPAYLAMSARQQIERTQAIDELTLRKVMGYGFARDRVLESVRMGYQLLTSRRFEHLIPERQMAIIYNLLLDQKRKTEQKEDTFEEPKSPVSPLGSYEGKESSRGGGSSGALTPSGGSPSSAGVAAAAGRWVLGKPARDDPARIMTELYRTLRKLGFEWKTLSLYRLKARFPVGLKDREGKTVDASQVVKISVQVYKSPRGGACVVDIQKTFGQTFTFLDFSSRIVSELRLTTPALATTTAPTTT